MADKVKFDPITNPELEKIMEELKEGQSPEKQAKLTECLKKARLLSPCDFDVPVDKQKPGTMQNVHPSQIKFYLLNTKDGKTFFPAFTKLENAKYMKFSEGVEPKMVVRTVKDFDTLVQDGRNKATGIIINPGLNNIVIPGGLIGNIAGRTSAAPQIKPQAPAPMVARYTEPPVYPTKMVNAIYEKCENTESISRVWLKAKLLGQAMTFYIAVEAEDHSEHVLNEIREAAVPEAKDIPVEVVFSTEDILKNIVKESVALYDKNLGF